MRKRVKFIRNEEGQAVVLIAFLIVILLSFAAFVLDIGMAYLTKSKIQSAADAAALAAAMDLPNVSTAISNANAYAAMNGIVPENTTVLTPYNGDSTKIKVTCTDTVEYSFAKIFGFTDKTLSAQAVAQKYSQWSGEALPFLNLDDDYTSNPEIEAWEKTSPGDFESISNYEIINPNDPATLYFKVDYLNGVELKKGTVATIKQEVGYVYDQHKPDEPVYILSLSSAVMNSGQVMLKDSTVRSLSSLKNGDIIDPSQIVLLECIFHDYDYKGKTLYLTCLHVYDIANNQFPTNYSSPDGGTCRLVE
ncbi:pilus assembly protein TadG-related protein [Dehalobacter sp. DCM]|uniref:pilus assembly protein TadG-related protein n=1 Tax=Dehalobacter sp. DCM TaxID=2907827 RepID=UPI00308168FE|nr:pilus assembly protein TadG-related protein [Dehalobacter sp. DCM]